MRKWGSTCPAGAQLLAVNNICALCCQNSRRKAAVAAAEKMSKHTDLAVPQQAEASYLLGLSGQIESAQHDLGQARARVVREHLRTIIEPIDALTPELSQAASPLTNR